MTSRPSTAAPILAVLAIVLVTLGAYVGGYYRLPVTKEWRSVVDDHLVSVERVYPLPVLETVFKPAAAVEARLRGIEVTVTYRPRGLE